MRTSPERAREILDGFGDQRILVVGDLMLDRYVYGSVSRISPEAPVPVVQVSRDQVMPGGASNVAWNIQTLGGKARVAGLTGDDVAARELKDLLSGKQVDVSGIRSHPDLDTTVKTRIIAEQQQVVRVDRERTGPLPEGLQGEFCAWLTDAVGEADGVILEDYGKGVMEQAVVDTVLAAAETRGIPVGFDPKDNHQLRIDGVTLMTPNRREAFLAAAMEDPGAAGEPMQDEPLLQVASDLYSRLGPVYLLITLGPHGMMLIHKGEPSLHVPTRAREVYDVSGAGDTVIATSLLAMAAGASAEEAAMLANDAAGVVVAKLGTASCTAAELLAHMDA